MTSSSGVNDASDKILEFSQSNWSMKFCKLFLHSVSVGLAHNGKRLVPKLGRRLSSYGGLYQDQTSPRCYQLKQTFLKKITKLKTSLYVFILLFSFCFCFFLQVYDKFPGHDLTSRKDFIKDTVRKVREN